MALPKIDVPTFEMLMPSQKKTVTFRPFLVKEEKILLMSQQGSDKEIITAIKQVLNNCILDSWFNPDMLTTFDLEYMFIKLRAVSVDNIVTLSYKDTEDDKQYNFEVDLDTIVVTEDPTHTNVIKVNDEIGIIMRYPPADVLNDAHDDATLVEMVDILIRKCVDKIYDKDKVYIVSEEPQDELEDFINSLKPNTYDEMRHFFETLPRVEHTIKYTNSLGHKRTIELTSLRDFFTWG